MLLSFQMNKSEKSLDHQMLVLESLCTPMSDAVKFSEKLIFLPTGCFHHKVWGLEFFLKVIVVRLLNAVNFM